MSTDANQADTRRFVGQWHTREPLAAALLETAARLAPEVRAAATAAEQAGRLPPALVAALRDAGFFRMFVPAALGGGEVDPVTVGQVVEEVSRADGSTGWCVMVGAQVGYFAGFLPADGAAEVFSSPDIVTGGQFAASGRAEPAEGGYRVSGRWSFVSGVLHCDWLYGVCRVDGAGDGTAAPEQRVAFLPAREWTVVENWDVTGLRATGSHDIAVEGAFVPTRRTVALPMQTHGPAPGPHYAPAAILLAFVTQGSHALGVARGALDAFGELAGRTTRTGAARPLGEQPTVQERVGRAEAELAAARAYLYGATADVWTALQAGATPPPLQLRHLRLAITHALTAAVPIVDAAYTLAGAAAIRVGGHWSAPSATSTPPPPTARPVRATSRRWAAPSSASTSARPRSAVQCRRAPRPQR